MLENEMILNILQYFVAPLVVGLLTALIIWLCGKISKNNSGKRLTVKEIKAINDRDIESFITLYNSRIEENIRISAEQIVEFIDPNPCDGVNHHLYVCKRDDTILGFVKIIVVPKDDYLFIAYIAVDDKDQVAVKYGVQLMMKYIIKHHITCKNGVKNLYTEIKKSANGRHITGLAKIIARRAKENGLNAYVFDMDYIEPNMPNDEFALIPEQILSLIWIPWCQYNKSHISKTALLNIIKSIYLNIYVPSCKLTCNCFEYSTYINNLMAKYKSTLPNKIKVLSLTDTNN